MRPFKTAETIESQTQSILLHAGSPNYAEEQWEATRNNMLDEMAADAARMAEEMTLPDGGEANADNMEIDSSTKAADHCTKRQAVAACEDGGLEGRAIRFDDCEHTVFEGKTSGNGSDETDLTARQDQIHNGDLLKQMTLLCQTVQSLGWQMQEVQNLGKQMQDGFATESCRSQEDYKKMEAAMTTKMEEGFRNEEQARQQAQKEIMAGLKNEANARQMVQNDLQAIKDKIRQLESGSGSGSTVGSDVSTAVGRGPSGTFARPLQGVAVRLNDLFMPRRMELKGWVTDYKQCRYQGLTDTEVSNLINDSVQDGT